MKKIFLIVVVALFLSSGNSTICAMDIEMGHETNGQKCLQAIIKKAYSEAYSFFITELKENDYLIVSPLSANVLLKLREHDLIGEMIFDEDGSVSKETKRGFDSIPKEEFNIVFEDIYTMLHPTEKRVRDPSKDYSKHQDEQKKARHAKRGAKDN